MINYINMGFMVSHIILLNLMLQIGHSKYRKIRKISARKITFITACLSNMESPRGQYLGLLLYHICQFFKIRKM